MNMIDADSKNDPEKDPLKPRTSFLDSPMAKSVAWIATIIPVLGVIFYAANMIFQISNHEDRLTEQSKKIATLEKNASSAQSTIGDHENRIGKLDASIAKAQEISNAAATEAKALSRVLEFFLIPKRIADESEARDAQQRELEAFQKKNAANLRKPQSTIEAACQELSTKKTDTRELKVRGLLGCKATSTYRMQ